MTRSNIHPHLAVEKLWKTSVVDPQSHAGLRAGGPATLRRLARYEVTRTGDVRKKPRKERELLHPIPNVYLRLAVRTAPPCVTRAELSGVVGAAASTTPTCRAGLGRRRAERYRADRSSRET